MYPEGIEEQLIEHFYKWEMRGRGWQLYPHPIALEPPFRPFLTHYVWTPPQVDDARRPTALSSFVRRLRGEQPEVQPIYLSPAQLDQIFVDPLPEVFSEDRPLAELQLFLPADWSGSKDLPEQLLVSLSSCRELVSLEVIGTSEAISIQLSCHERDLAHVREVLSAFAPEVGFLRQYGHLADVWKGSGTEYGLVVDFGLANEFMRPIRGLRTFGTDPFTALVGALGNLKSGEVAVFQVLFEKTREPWAESILRAVHDNEGDPFFATGPEVSKLAREKVGRPLFAAVVRLAARARTRADGVSILRRLTGALSQHTLPLSNELIPLENEGFEDVEHEACLLLRSTRRPGMLLNSDELAGLVHLPGPEVVHPRLVRQTRRTKAAPETTLGHRTVLGTNTHNGATRTVTLSPEHRMRHTYIIGGTGTGKSTLLLSMISQDIGAGHGVAVLDPHGDLVDAVLARIPEERTDDVVLIDPADEGYPVGFNILSAHSDLERTLLSSDLVAVFRRLSTSWGDQMNSVFANAILAFLESSAGGTLADLRRFLVDKEFRTAFLQTVGDPEVVFYWQREFPLLKNNPQAPILTRLDAFLRPKLIRNMVGQRENKLPFARIMDTGGILLAKLSQGTIGEENSYLLGALLVAKLHQTALSRQSQEATSRKDFFLYADEFHHFATPSMSSLLSGVRKYRMGLTLAHQELGQLGGRSDELVGAVLGNASTRIVFRVGDSDARFLAGGFSSFEAQDLQSLGVGEAVCRVERADQDFNLTTTELPPVSENAARERQARVRDSSRRKYATPASELAVRAPELPVPELQPAPPESAPPKKVYVPDAAPPAPAATTPPVTLTLPAPAGPGRGGQQHKYLQSLIRRFGEDRGYRVELEQPVLDGAGYVDVSLARADRRIAIEISVTTPLEHEIGNVQKCLAAGFDWVVLVLAEKKALSRARQALVQALPEAAQARVQVLSPEELIAFLDARDAESAVPESTVAGYKVKVKYGSGGKAGDDARSRSLGQVLANSLNRLRRKE